MHSPLVATSHPSAVSDLARLAIPLAIITASIVAALWIDRGALVTADNSPGASSASVQQTAP
jgi:hypothetical protein